MTLTKVVEALLFSAQKPLSIRELTTAIKGAEDELSPNQFARVREAEVAGALEQLKVEYIEQERGFQLNEKAEGWQLATDPKYAGWVRQLFPAPKPARLSAPALETRNSNPAEATGWLKKRSRRHHPPSPRRR